MSTEQTEKCGQYFQADTALCFKCGMPKGHKGSHGGCSQDVLAAARDVAAERIAIPASSSSEGASLAALQHELIFYKDAANAQRVRAEGAELSLRIEIDNVQKAVQRLAEVTRHLTEAQERVQVLEPAWIEAREIADRSIRARQAAEATIARVKALSENWRKYAENDRGHCRRALSTFGAAQNLGSQGAYDGCAADLDAALAAPAATKGVTQ